MGLMGEVRSEGGVWWGKKGGKGLGVRNTRQMMSGKEITVSGELVQSLRVDKLRKS